jgi:SAM-dependent methyltransferase
LDNKQVSDTWERGSHYEQYVGRWSRKVAPLFLAGLDAPQGRRWLDVGCGTGALCAAILDHCAPTTVTGVEPSAGFLKTAKENLGDLVTLHSGSATAIPLGDAEIDVVVSGLVLNFVDDPLAALAEMARVSKPGGVIAAYVWDYAGKMEFMRHFWDAAVALDPDAAPLDEGVRFPLCQPAALEDLFVRAGLKTVAVTAIDIPTRFANFDEYWQPFLGGQGPAPAYTVSLADKARTRLRDHVQARMPVEPDGAIALMARVWAVRSLVSI